MISRSDLVMQMGRINVLHSEINEHAPISATKMQEFRADLAGLLTVLIVARYESCVKSTLRNYAFLKNQDFGQYVERRYAKLNSSIRLSDLHKLCRTFNPEVGQRFKETLHKRKDRIQKFTKQDIHTCYNQLLEWRHLFAHEGSRKTTVEEVFNFHRCAKHVIFAFYESFES